MLPKTAILLLLGACLSCLGQTSAQGLKLSSSYRDAYFEVGLNSLNYAQTGLRLSPTAVRAIAGRNMGPTFSYEGMLAIGSSQGTDTIAGKNAAVKMDPMFGAYLRARKELASGLEVFGRMGVASVVKNLDGAYFTDSPTSQRMGSVSYGLGVKIRLKRDSNFVADYMSYYNRKQESIDGLSLGLAFDY